MEPILARCGFRCDLCLAFGANIDANPTNRNLLAQGWLKYYGIVVRPEEIYCPGCLSDSPTMDSSCPVRPCVLLRGFGTCAECDGYICPHLADRIVTCAAIQKQIGEDIPHDDYFLFIKPYENKPRLEALRSTVAR